MLSLRAIFYFLSTILKGATMTNHNDNVICPGCKTGHHVEDPKGQHYIYCESCDEAISQEEILPITEDAEENTGEEGFDTDNVTFYDHGHSHNKGYYLSVCMKRCTPEAYEEVHNRFFTLFGVYPQTRDKFCYGETTFYASHNGERGAAY